MGRKPKPTPQKVEKSLSKSFYVIPVIAVLVSVAFFYFPSRRIARDPTEIQIVEASNSTPRISWDIPCGKSEPTSKASGCSPNFCRRVVLNNFTDYQETLKIREFMERVMAFGGGTGGPTIFDITQGALSVGDKFIDLYAKLKHGAQPLPFDAEDIEFISDLIARIKGQIEEEFDVSGLVLTSPTFFSKISAGLAPKTINDEYWHPHVDTKAYGSFVYTSLLYLSEEGRDFRGGSFAFLRNLSDPASVDILVRPAVGRLSFFTSGNENPHLVQKVTQGTRFAFTVAFTCDPRKGIKSPLARASALVQSKKTQ